MNRHEGLTSADFKSAASTNSATRAREKRENSMREASNWLAIFLDMPGAGNLLGWHSLYIQVRFMFRFSCIRKFRRIAWFAIATWLFAVPSAAAPSYELDELQLRAVLNDLKSWLPGEWNSYPQVWYDENVTMPAEGAHEHWHRTFALIDAPHISDTVFYGQVNVGGPTGPILARSQVLYKAAIDAAKGVVTIIGQPLAEPERFADLHRRPELWPQARMPDADAVRCRFDWRRHGRQLVGTLDNREPLPAGAKEPGTCTYTARNGMAFLADAEWVLSPDELWLYDINLMGTVQFVGRKDRTHLRLYRTTPYQCQVSDGSGKRNVAAHDRGYRQELIAADASKLQVSLLRAWYPDEIAGLVDELRLVLRSQTGAALATATAAPKSAIRLQYADIAVSCAVR